jgi:tetratricopeptide (TPR) repeat protein
MASAMSQGLVDSCAIVLTAPTPVDATSTGSPVDRRILRYQSAILQGITPMAALENLGWAYTAKARSSSDPGYYKLAELTAQCIESKQPGTAAAMLLQGHVLHNLHRFKEAEVLARALIGRRGLWFEYGLLGDVLMEQGRLDDAAKAYQHMMDQRPGPQVYSRAAHLRWLKGDLPGAIEMMQSAVRATGSRDPAPAAWAEVRLGTLLLQSGDFAAARAAVIHALELQPDNAPALLTHGRILLGEGKWAEAISRLTQAVQLNPLPEYQWALIEALHEAGRVEDAGLIESQLMQRGAFEDPRTFALYLATTGYDIELALRLSRQELEVREDVFTLDSVAWALAASGRIQEAASFSRRALAEGTRDARLYLHAGVIAGQAGDFVGQARWLTEASALEHMLLPSERARLAIEFAALQPRISSLATEKSARQDEYAF